MDPKSMTGIDIEERRLVKIETEVVVKLSHAKECQRLSAAPGSLGVFFPRVCRGEWPC